MNPEFLALSNLKNSGISNLEPKLHVESYNSEKNAEPYGQDTQRNTNVNYIVFVNVS